jgi:hypothetical protein
VADSGVYVVIDVGGAVVVVVVDVVVVDVVVVVEVVVVVDVVVVVVGAVVDVVVVVASVVVVDPVGGGVGGVHAAAKISTAAQMARRDDPCPPEIRRIPAMAFSCSPNAPHPPWV